MGRVLARGVGLAVIATRNWWVIVATPLDPPYGRLLPKTILCGRRRRFDRTLRRIW